MASLHNGYNISTERIDENYVWVLRFEFISEYAASTRVNFVIIMEAQVAIVTCCYMLLPTQCSFWILLETETTSNAQECNVCDAL